MVNKRFATILILVLLAMSLYASFGGGYSVYPIGERFGDESFGGAAISGYISPTGLNNKGKVEADVLLSMVRPVFRGVNLVVSTPILSTVDHPFNYFFSNKVLWQPTAGVGVQYRAGNEWRLMAQLSPFAFQVMSFMYEILSPYVSMDFNGDFGWGITIMKFSASFGRL